MFKGKHTEDPELGVNFLFRYPYLTTPHHTTPHHTTPHLTSPHHTSPHLTSPFHSFPFSYISPSLTFLCAIVIWCTFISVPSLRLLPYIVLHPASSCVLLRPPASSCVLLRPPASSCVLLRPPASHLRLICVSCVFVRVLFAHLIL